MNKIRTRLVAAAALIITAAASLVIGASPAQAIVGGHDATRPHREVVMLDIDTGNGDGFQPACAATITSYHGPIKKFDGVRVAVTAAHCVTTVPTPVTPSSRTLPAGAMRLRVGSAHLLGGVPVRVTSVTPAPGWAWAQFYPAMTGDFAVLTVPDLPKWVPSVPIPAVSSRPTAVDLYGWGFTAPANVPPMAERLQQLHTRIVDSARCDGVLITVGEICVDGTDGRGCNGDGGGGLETYLHHKLFVLGVGSRGSARLCDRGDGVITDVRYYPEFINSVIDGTYQWPSAIISTPLTAARAPALSWQ